jgi:hypothetical protein
MDEDQNIDFESFFDDEEATPDTAEGSDTGAETEQPAEESAEETPDPATESEGEPEQPQQTAPEAGKEAETFTLKVNKETRQVSRDEVVTLAQKGADYDRVKGALDQSNTAYQALERESADARQAYAVLSEIADGSKITVPELLEHFQLEQLKAQGIPEGEAKERLARQRLEKENAALRGNQSQQKTAEQQMKERADREIAEFNRMYPDVTITDQLVDALMNDVHSGMTLVQAYQKKQNADLAAENSRLAAELAAAKKNAENRSASPGSMGDSGARKSKDQYDDFFSAFD